MFTSTKASLINDLVTLKVNNLKVEMLKELSEYDLKYIIRQLGFPLLQNDMKGNIDELKRLIMSIYEEKDLHLQRQEVIDTSSLPRKRQGFVPTKFLMKKIEEAKNGGKLADNMVLK